MRDFNQDGFPDPVPDNWQDYTGGGCGCLIAFVVGAVILYFLFFA